MTTPSQNGSVVTFYSWKGGVGRTFALANTALLLAGKDKKVLIVDFDLEAPGLDKYFVRSASNIENEKEAVTYESPVDSSGLLGLFVNATKKDSPGPHLHEWQNRLHKLNFHASYFTSPNQRAPISGTLDLLSSGFGARDYSKRLGNFSWSKFYRKMSGAWLEELRQQWRERYDYVFVDSRTGLSDSSGICTIQLPDVLVLVFTANDQSFDGGLKVVSSARRPAETSLMIEARLLFFLYCRAGQGTRKLT